MKTEPRPKSKNEVIGHCIAHVKNVRWHMDVCKMCGENPCSGIECLRARIYELESEVQEHDSELWSRR